MATERILTFLSGYHGLRLRLWQLDQKAGPLAWGAGNDNAASVGLHKLFDNGQSQPQPAILAFVETLKDMGQLVRRDAVAGIHDVNGDGRGCRSGGL